MTDSIREIEPDLRSRLEKEGIWLNDDSITQRTVEGHGTLPVLELPEHALRFEVTKGYWPSFSAFGDNDGKPLLVGQIHAFDLNDGVGGWAIPTAYMPGNELQALMQILGFDEGWENSAPGTLFLAHINDHWLRVFELAIEQDQLCVTVKGGKSLYPMALTPSSAIAIKSFIKHKC